ncbi:hypothetical protein XELAEV_18004317mg [Xenopus laevis]|uniref:Uncharacterized protein n=1 Tax=Xenopus laevis TaxID=8355 RepID=A0A974BRJ2_XENLA|nr:hypothetical protein XELAEV_18004317mg [Xenopus laevis]
MNIEHPLLMLSTSASKMSTKKIMEEAGLHKIHSAYSPLPPPFRRWLHFVNPNEASISCIHNIEGSMQFFWEIGASAAARRATNTKECQEVLTMWHPYCVELIDWANTRIDLEERDRMSVLFYIEALLTLQHLQRPSVAQNMTVSFLQKLLYHTGQSSTDQFKHFFSQIGSTVAGEDTIPESHYRQCSSCHKGEGCSTSWSSKEVEMMWFYNFFRRVQPTFVKRSMKGDNGYFVLIKEKQSKTQQLIFQIKCYIFYMDTDSSLKDQELIKRFLRADSNLNESNIKEYMRAAIRVSELQRTWAEPSHSKRWRSASDTPRQAIRERALIQAYRGHVSSGP